MATTALLLASEVALPRPAHAALSGWPDPGFGDAGLVETVFEGETSSAAKAAALAPDGRIVVAGSVTGPAHGDRFAVVRYLPHGQRDPTFGTDGRVLLDLAPARDGGFPEPGASAVALAPDGSIVLTGSVQRRGPDAGPGPRDLAVVRLTADGRPDEGFGRGGVVRVRFPDLLRRTGVASGPWVVGRAVAVRPDGRIVVGASISPAEGGWSPLGLGLARLLPDGRPDRGFGRRGMVVRASGLRAMTVLDDGRILTTGAATSRFTADGHPDRSFGRDGTVALRGIAVAGADDGRMLVGTDPDDPALPETGSARMVRLRPGGEVDATYGKDGRAVLGSDSPVFVGFAVAPGGGAVAATRHGLLGVTAGGRPDRSFGGNGETYPRLFPAAVVRAADSSLVVPGASYPSLGSPEEPAQRWRVARYLGAAGIAARPAGRCGQLFDRPGVQVWRVPADVRQVRLEAAGGAGGSAGGFAGGRGGSVSATVPVRPGEWLRVEVGGAGTDAAPGGTGAATGGGGPGGGGRYPGGGGGGASRVADGPDLADSFVVAGGGGGAGTTGSGGAGGGPSGGDAFGGGTGGKESSPGEDGPSFGPRADVLLDGWVRPNPAQADQGNGSPGGGRFGGDGGGGGGGGRTGGGGGAPPAAALQTGREDPRLRPVTALLPAGGGGGGSGYARRGAADVVMHTGANPGPGRVRITCG